MGIGYRQDRTATACVNTDSPNGTGGPSLGGGGRKFMLKVKVRPRPIEIHRKTIPKDFRVSMSVPGCAIPILGLLLFSKYLLSKTRDCEQNRCRV